MNSQADFLERLTRVLDEAEVPYAVCGSAASSTFGIPRATHDIDLLIAPTPEQLEALIVGLDKECFVQPLSARNAFRSRSLFNVIDRVDGRRADFIFLKDSAFSLAEFSRRVKEIVIGKPAWVKTPEDTVLSKLKWAQMGESERQFRDVVEVVAVQWKKLDRDYLRRWAADLGVIELLERALAAAGQQQMPD